MGEKNEINNNLDRILYNRVPNRTLGLFDRLMCIQSIIAIIRKKKIGKERNSKKLAIFRIKHIKEIEI